MSRYYTGLPCSKGHVAERLTANFTCVVCQSETAKSRVLTEAQLDRVREIKREDYRRHAEKRKARVREYRVENADAVALRKAEYNARNKGKLSQYFRERYVRDKAALSTAQRARYRARRPEILAKMREYRANNPEKIAALSRNAKARRKNAQGRHTSQDIHALYAAQDGRCAVCFCDLSVTGYHVDHIEPLARGGSNGPENLQLLCPTHNLQKSAKPFEEFLLEYIFS